MVSLNMKTASVKPSVPGKARDRWSSESGSDPEEEQHSKVRRENQQLIIYIFVALVIGLAWILGVFEFSFIWIFLLIVLTFVIWWSKVMALTEQCIKEKEITVHRKRALRQSETAEWLNFIINRWWVFSSSSITDLIKRGLDPLLADVKPAFLESIELQSFSVGERTPFVKYIHVYENADGMPGAKRAMSWASVVAPPTGLQQAQQYQVVLEADVGLQCDDFKMVFRSRLGGKWMGMNLDVAIEKLNISGKMQFVLNLNMDTPFPHVSSVSLAFAEKPEVWFAVRVLRALQMMEIPILKSWLHHLVMDGLTQALVDPGKIDLKIDSVGPTKVPAKAKNKQRAQGVLTVTVSGEQSKSSVFMEDTRYCQLRLGDQREHTQLTQGSGAWQDTCSFLVYSLSADKLSLKCKSKVLLSTYTLAQFELALTDFPLEHKPCLDTSVEDKVPKRQGGGTIKLSLNLEYTALSSVDPEVEHGVGEPRAPSDVVAGVMYVCLHSAANLLGLDRNGYSDPYCVVYSNGKKVKTTHYVCRSKNPKWDVSTEFIVGDFTKTMLSFICYDWDGRNASEDDFLGSAHIVLTKDEPSVIKRNLTLGYNLLNVGQVDNNKLGTMNVSVIFRPVTSVVKSETQIQSNTAPDQQLGKGKGFINTAVLQHSGIRVPVGSDHARPPEGAIQGTARKGIQVDTYRQRLVSLKDKKGADTMGVGNLLSLGHGILELNIIKGKDLVPMDSNGFSDPYCEVRINGERKFTTHIKKKTLNPVWDEWVTTQLPKPNELLEITVWDRDPFFQKDFLGSLKFTLEELKENSLNPSRNGGWFALQRIQSGSVQLRFKVISQTYGEENEAGSPSGSTDSGCPASATPLVLPPGDPLELLDEADDDGTRGVNTGASIPPSLNASPAHSNGQGSQPRPSPTRHTGLPQIVTPTSQNTPDNSPKKGQTTPKRRFSFKMKRSSSEYGLKDAGTSLHAGPGQQFSQDTDSDGSTLYLNDRRQSLDNAMLGGGQDQFAGRYFGIRGQVLNVKGLQGNNLPLYCKIRLDSRPQSLRNRKSSHGKVIGKSPTVEGWSDAYFGFEFVVDQGHGVVKDSLLIFDIKSSGRDHLCTKGYTLEQLLGASHEVTKWLHLENGIELEVTLIHTNTPLLATGKTRSSGRGFFHTLRSSSTHKIKDS